MKILHLKSLNNLLIFWLFFFHFFQINKKCDRLDSILWRVKIYDNSTVYLDEKRATNFDDIISGYFMSKVISFQNHHPQSDLQTHIREILRIFHRTFVMYEKHLIEGLRKSGLFPGDFSTCSSVCGFQHVCLEMKRLDYWINQLHILKSEFWITK